MQSRRESFNIETPANFNEEGLVALGQILLNKVPTDTSGYKLQQAQTMRINSMFSSQAKQPTVLPTMLQILKNSRTLSERSQTDLQNLV
jgi:hypothetical protein